MNTTGMIAMLVYLVIAISQLRLRRKMEREGQEIKLKMWFFPWLSYLVIAFIVASLIAMTFIEQYRVLVISTGGAALIVIFIGITLQFKAYRRKLAASVHLNEVISSISIHPCLKSVLNFSGYSYCYRGYNLMIFNHPFLNTVLLAYNLLISLIA